MGEDRAVKKSVVATLVALALSGCAMNSNAGPGVEPSTDAHTVDVYATVIRCMAGMADSYGRIYVQDGPCDAEFVADAKAIQDRIFEATGAGIGPDMLIRFGRISEEAGRLEIPASAFCGGLCGRWMTLVVQDADGAWKVTSTTAPWPSPSSAISGRPRLLPAGLPGGAGCLRGIRGCGELGPEGAGAAPAACVAR
jgi:hypothetical protein